MGDSVFDELKQPKNWAYMASALQKAASLMDYTKKRDITDWRFIPIYRMLIGFSLENLIKGILVAEGHPCMNDGARLHHRLVEYATLIKGITLDDKEKRLLDDVGTLRGVGGPLSETTKPQGHGEDRSFRTATRCRTVIGTKAIRLPALALPRHRAGHIPTTQDGLNHEIASLGFALRRRPALLSVKEPGS